jgi:hypothetical protein
MSPEQQAMMGAWMKAATPGEEHDSLAKQVGIWTAEVKAWMDPSAEPEVSTGTFHREMTLGGRVLTEHYERMVMGMPFKGFGMNGYDNVSGRWWSTWNDNLSTGPTQMWGEWSEKEGAMVFYGEGPDMMTGGMVKMKTIVRHPNADQEILEVYDLRTGTPVMTMQITSTRK